jgi:hypothetical protein
MPQNINKLNHFLVEKCKKIFQKTVNNLIFFMKNKCELILVKNGNKIQY